MDSRTVPDAEPTLFEVTAPARVEGQSNAETVFTWMRVNRTLWMLDGGPADRVEALVGTARLIHLVSMRMRFERANRGHAALALPDDNEVREHAFRRLARFLELHIDLEAFTEPRAVPEAAAREAAEPPASS
jgi:hypothetical protein